MYIFVADKKQKDDVDSSFLENQRGICTVLQHNLSDYKEVRFIVDVHKRLSHGRPLYAVFQPRSEFMYKGNKIQYAKSFSGIESMLVIGVSRDDPRLLKTRDVIAHIKHYSKIPQVKRGYNIADISRFIREDVPPGSLVLLFGIKNSQAILREVV